MNDVTLPKILGDNKLPIRDKMSEDIKKRRLEDDPKEFEEKMKKVIEIKIYLKQNFHKTDIDDTFLSNLDIQYATQYLERMSLLSTKFNIKKLLKIKPIEKCDFHLTVDQIRNKPVKLLHIFPNNKSVNNSSLHQVLSNEEFEQVMNKTSLNKDAQEDKLTNIKKREIKKEELWFYVPDTIDALFTKAKEDIQDKMLSVRSHGLIEQQVKVFDLSIENIRNKYINPSSQIIVNNQDMNNKAKLLNIEKASKTDIISNEKFEFPYLDIDLNRDIIKEVNKPIEIPLEIIIKDIHYILDNFPIDQLINIDEPLKNENRSNFFQNNGLEILKNVEKNYAKTKDYYKIKSISKKDILNVYKRIQSENVYRIIGLLVNLLYWIVFAFINRIQIDKYTKQQLLFKILEELHLVEEHYNNKKMFDKFFMPILIIIIRIETEALFQKKFKTFFEDDNNRDKALEKINELITTIFDPNCYFNTFTVLSMNMSKAKHKINHNLYPNYKTKVYATSNFVNQLFKSFNNEQNVKKFYKGKDIKQEKGSPKINLLGNKLFYF